MIKNNLIKSCVCGNSNSFEQQTINNLNILKCRNCGVIHQELTDWSKQQYIDFYKTDYHKHYQKKKGVVTYEERYEHDCNVANLRLESYKKFIKKSMVGLDIGSSNSAFVHMARKKGLRCLGLEPGDTIGDDHVTIRGDLESTYLNPNYFDFITMHDSIEHMINVNSALSKVSSILKTDGILILDLPDYFVEEGKHHWKYIEHLWMFRKEDLERILNNLKFTMLDISSPIPGKLVFVAKKVS